MNLLEYTKYRWNKYLIESGRKPRGRTLSKQSPPTVGDSVLTATTSTVARHFNKDGKEILEDRREVVNRKFTTAGRDFVAGAFKTSGATDLTTMKYHGSGTGTTAEANTDATLVTEVGSRATGTNTASGGAVTSVGTITYDNTYAITEHGIFSASSNGTLLDRTKFDPINVVSGDKIEFTFTLTFAAEA